MSYDAFIHDFDSRDSVFTYPDSEDLEGRYQIFSTVGDDPEDVMCWCETDTFWKAQWAFHLVATHAERLGFANVALVDTFTNRTLLPERPGGIP